MSLITEYRILMPLTVEEYEIGQRYTVSAASLAETGGGEGIEVRQNRPFANYKLMNGRYTSGQYTQKLYHLKSKVPAYVKMMAPTGSLTCLEESWNCFPYCRTILTNPLYMKDGMELCVETMHLQDNGTTQNALQLSPDELSIRKVVYLNIADEANLKPEDTTQPNSYQLRQEGEGTSETKLGGNSGPNHVLQQTGARQVPMETNRRYRRKETHECLSIPESSPRSIVKRGFFRTRGTAC